MGKASLAAYTSKREQRNRMPYHRHGVHAQRQGGFGGVKSSSPFGGMKRKDGQSVNWGLLGSVGMNSYDGPKRFVPRVELDGEQRDARNWYYRTIPRIIDALSPVEYRVPVVTDRLGFIIPNGEPLFDLCRVPSLRGQKYHVYRGFLPDYWSIQTAMGEARDHERDELDLLMLEYVERGGVITQCKRGPRHKPTFSK